MSHTTRQSVASTAPAPVLTPTLTYAVPREYVHRAAIAEVFLTGWRPMGADSFTVTAQWPRQHSFYLTQEGLHDPLLLSETIRQTLPLLSHAAYDVPFGTRLSWDFFRYTLNPSALAAQFVPAELELTVTASDIRRRSGQLAAVTMNFDVSRDGVPLATAETRFGCYSPAVYQRLRAGRADLDKVLAGVLAPPPPVSPALVGRDRPQDVVLAPADGDRRWRLRTDTAHPVLFDHPVDHAPGMLLLEAARQATQALDPHRRVLPVGMDIAFFRYVEFDSPCWITAEPDQPEWHDQHGRRRTKVTAWQEEQVVFSATVTTETVAAR
ncbi:ScbA/BarX family gamma-butyrolactone biosynthesis protein [Streptomyces sp. NPDC093546]|uniref:ScbA/BarX family gamma-butyrolactone biosynthesis protein n=1 Tax=Streptomyces sp. NPDC093546 TaxID=3366040 RepID=UPI003813A1DA